MKTLDFMIIGAQKCATTTLFELLRKHPDINMPLEKEVPFFTGDNTDADAWSEFARKYYGPESDQLWGKATPQYMACGQSARRIARIMPSCKLIAVLRDPIERSASHFRMGLRRGTETRSFDDALQCNLDPQAVNRSRHLPVPTHAQGYETEGDFYLSWSEYGRQLQTFLDYFPRQQLLVLNTEDLQRDPRGTLDSALKFLELGTGFEPRGLGELMHVGGGQQRLPNAWRVWLRKRSVISWIWAKVPAQHQGRLRFLYERWNTTQSKSPLTLSRATREALVEHFAEDLRCFSDLGLALPPWAANYCSRESRQA